MRITNTPGIRGADFVRGYRRLGASRVHNQAINHVVRLTFVEMLQHATSKTIQAIRTMLMFAPVPRLRTRRTTTGKRSLGSLVIGAIGKLTVVVSSVLLLAIITATLATLDAWLTSNLP